MEIIKSKTIAKKGSLSIAVETDLGRFGIQITIPHSNSPRVLFMVSAIDTINVDGRNVQFRANYYIENGEIVNRSNMNFNKYYYHTETKDIFISYDRGFRIPNPDIKGGVEILHPGFRNYNEHDPCYKEEYEDLKRRGLIWNWQNPKFSEWDRKANRTCHSALECGADYIIWELNHYKELIAILDEIANLVTERHADYVARIAKVKEISLERRRRTNLIKKKDLINQQIDDVDGRISSMESNLPAEVKF